METQPRPRTKTSTQACEAAAEAWPGRVDVPAHVAGGQPTQAAGGEDQMGEVLADPPAPWPSAPVAFGIDVGGSRARSESFAAPPPRSASSWPAGVSGDVAGRGEGPDLSVNGARVEGARKSMLLRGESSRRLVGQDLGGFAPRSGPDHEAPSWGESTSKCADLVAIAVGVAVHEGPGVGLDREGQTPLSATVQGPQAQLGIGLADRAIVDVARSCAATRTFIAAAAVVDRAAGRASWAGSPAC